MNRIGHVFSASTVAAISFGGVSQAAVEMASEDGRPQSVQAPQSVQPVVGKRLTVVPLRGLQTSDPVRQALDAQDPHSAQARKLQAAIIANPKLMRQLDGQGVDVTTIVGMVTVDDGSISVFTASA
ncbi:MULTISPECIES: hypothetical protein [Rhizobium/Agrobacterium group]|uniref:hypothetical protein n=1 Tax=Rhizobium/Agrobacterium group TaxID=227290 RepID=UPI0008DC1E9B|nr:MULTISPECIES: hypothetical protein [Rhizobium/Agrobacterium group]MCF1434289.1 hypothetical protein [Allorhizobium ampelinum]MUO89559.1 hypothetical protein [Agrobacterium vitis]MUZ51701.1 hypothetical protein [Agrobacterium vitis]MUZ90082.1 hypothetical protein [Agrobacterium vitis]MVA39303.1 hypothetical protein [Agrobacterium vitis]